MLYLYTAKFLTIIINICNRLLFIKVLFVNVLILFNNEDKLHIKQLKVWIVLEYEKSRTDSTTTSENVVHVIIIKFDILK